MRPLKNICAAVLSFLLVFFHMNLRLSFGLSCDTWCLVPRDQRRYPAFFSVYLSFWQIFYNLETKRPALNWLAWQCASVLVHYREFCMLPNPPPFLVIYLAEVDLPAAQVPPGWTHQSIGRGAPQAPRIT